MNFLASLNLPARNFIARRSKTDLRFPLFTERKTILLASIVINLLALAFPLLMLQLYDRILPHQSLDTMTIFAVAVCIAAAMEAMTRLLRSYITAWISSKFEHKVMMDLAEKILLEPLSSIEAQGVGSVLENFKSVSTLKNHHSGQTFQQLLDLPFAILYLLIIFVLNVWIGLLLTAGYLVFILIVWKVCANDSALMKKQKVADLKRNNFLRENLDNVHTLKAMSMESTKLRQYERLQERSARLMSQISYALEMSSGIGTVFGPLMTTLVVSLGAWLVISHQLTNGELAACALLGMRSLSPLQRLGGMWSKYRQDRVLEQKLGKALNRQGIDPSMSLQIKPSLTQRSQHPSSLDLKDVSFKYPGSKHQLIKNITLSVKAGDCLAISSTSSAGLSTLLQVMSGLLSPNSGRVQVDGQDISGMHLLDVSAKVAYVPQHGQILEGSLLDNISMFDPSRVERALALADKLGLTAFVARMPRGWDSPVGDMASESLPPGYRQRIAIIRALSNDSNIIFVDDPGATMDAEGDAKFLGFLSSISNQVTLIIASQRPAYLRLASRRLLLLEGGLVEVPSDLVNTMGDVGATDNYLTSQTINYGIRSERISAASHQFGSLESFFDSLSRRTSLDPQKWRRVHATTDTLFKFKTDLSSCLPVLLKHLNARGSAREIAEALPDLASRLDLSGFQNVMAQLGYKALKVRCKLEELESRSLPCLFVPENGPAFIAVGRHGQQLRKSTSEFDEIEFENDLSIKGHAYFYELADPKLAENRSWVSRIMLRFSSLIGQATLSAVVTGLVVMTGPLFTMMVYSTIIPSGALDTLFYLAIGSILSLSLAYFFMRQRAQILSYIAGRIEYLFGATILHQILRMPPAFTERVSVGSQMSRLQSFDAIRDIFIGPLASTLLELPATVVLLVVLSIINPAALLVFVAMVGVYSLLYWLFYIPIRDRTTELSKASSKRSQFLVEMVSKIRTVRECGVELLWYERFRDISASATIAGFNAEKLSSMLVNISYFVMMLSALLIVAITVPLVFSQTVSSGALIASMMLMWRVLTPVQTFFTNMSRIEKVRTAANQVDSLMKIPGEPQNLAASQIGRELNGAIEFARVSFRYSMSADPALIGLEFKISPGEMIAISGPNGGGKSTLLKLVLGMYQPQTGAILIDNIDIRQIAPVELRRMIGYAPQDIQLFNATIAQNLRLANPDCSDEELYQALDIADALNQVLALPGGLNYRPRENASLLSASLRQKISMARCYLTRAPIMLFDEPSTSLDETGNKKFIEAMQALKGKRTVIFISHKPSHLLLADTLLVLDKGYVKAAGPPSDLLKRPATA